MTALCHENLKEGTSNHDWPMTNLATGEVFLLCWFCGCNAEDFKRRVREAQQEAAK